MTGRRRQLVVPREHGAWGILLVPLVTGAALGLLSGGSAAGLVPFTAAALALFWLRTPVESWMGTAPVHARTPDEFRLVRRTAGALVLISLAALAGVFRGFRNAALVWIGAAAGAAFAGQVIVRRAWRRARTSAQMLGALGLTSTSAAAYYVATGRLDRAAWSVWAANFLFAGNQVHYVQVRIRAAHTAARGEALAIGRWFLAGQVGLIAVLAASVAGRVLPWPATLAFAPVLVRGFAWFRARPEPLAIRSLGKRELLYACAFGVLLVLGMYRSGR